MSTFKKIAALMMTIALLMAGCYAFAEGEDHGPAFVAGEYTNGEAILTLAADGSFTLTDGGNSYSGVFENEYSFNGWTQSYSDTVTITEGAEALTGTVYPWYWTGKFSLAIRDGAFTGSFAPNNNIDAAAVDAEYAVVEDEASPTGYTATFTVPDADYKTVVIRGCWLAYNKKLTDENNPASYDATAYAPTEWENGMYYNGSSIYPMELVDDRWVFSVPLASSTMIYRCYHDIVDEKELASTELNGRNGKTAYIPYDAVKQSKSMDWSSAFPIKDGAGTLDFGVICKAADGKEVKLSVYTPNGYDAEGETLYPVVYLIPGGGTNYQSWYLAFHAKDIFDNMIANAKTAPAVVVSMDRTDALSYLFTDVIPYVESNYRVYTDSEHRALAGASMGSVFSTEVWLNPELSGNFAYYGFFSGAGKAAFESDFAELDEKTLVGLKKATILIGGGCQGDFNTFDGDNNSAAIARVHEWMDHYGIEHTYEVVGGGHDATTWATLLIDYVGNILWK